ncbi:MAG TPA: DUF433 domain-containing protein [Verrucomicrobiae bacterium]|jgi:uncharacterized protein (DUF433 family)
MKDRQYPHITRNPSILGGVPIIDNSRTPVRSIAGYYQLGMSVDDILHSLPHLTPAQVHSALAYYFDHKAAIDRDMARNNDDAHLQKQLQKLRLKAA